MKTALIIILGFHVFVLVAFFSFKYLFFLVGILYNMFY